MGGWSKYCLREKYESLYDGFNLLKWNYTLAVSLTDEEEKNIKKK